MNLNTIRIAVVNKKVIFATVAITVISAFVIPALLYKAVQVNPQDFPLSTEDQPIVDGMFDKEASQSQKSKKGIAEISNDLPKHKSFKTSTGTSVTYTIFFKPTDPFSLYVETIGINFLLDPKDTELPKNVQNFRETSEDILRWLKSKGMETSSVYIIWGGSYPIQQAAEKWINQSEEFPKVIKNGDTWQFETPPKTSD